MQGAVVASVLKKRREKKARSVEEEEIEHLIKHPVDTLVDDIHEVEGVLRDTEIHKLFGLRSRSDPIVRREIQIDGLLTKVREKLLRSSSYTRLFGTSIFFIVYVSFLFLQRDIESSYYVESSVIDLVGSSLPLLGNGGYMNSGLGSTGFLSTSEDFYSWFRGIAQVVFSDPVCGDGKCDGPDEFPGFGRFGCIKDCGKYKNVTSLTITLEDVVKRSSSELGISLKDSELEQDTSRVRFFYNIYSETMGDFLFESDTNATQLTFEAPDGDLTLVLYQESSVEGLVENQAVTSLFAITPSSFSRLQPRKTAIEYGNLREIIKNAVYGENALKTLCRSPSESQVAYCDTFNPQDVGYLFTSKYGVSGRIDLKDSVTGVLETIVKVGYCSILPNVSGSPYAQANKATIVESGSSCDEPLRLRRSRVRQATPRSHLPQVVPPKGTAGQDALDKHPAGSQHPPASPSSHKGKSDIEEVEGPKAKSDKNSLRTVSNCPSTGQTLTSTTGYVASGFTTTYSSNTLCTWTIAPSGNGNLTLTFQSFDVEYHSTCRYDWVKIYSCTSVNCLDSESTLLATLCGTMDRINPQLTSPTGIMKVSFKSDSSVQKAGFCASWGEGAYCPVKPDTPVFNKVEHVLRPLHNSYLYGISIAEIQVLSTSSVSYFRYTYSTDAQPTPRCDCADWPDTTTCPNAIKNGSKIVLFYEGATSRRYIRVNVIACNKYPDVTVSSRYYRYYYNYFLGPPVVSFSFLVNFLEPPASSSTPSNSTLNKLTSSANSSNSSNSSLDNSSTALANSSTVLHPLCGNFSVDQVWREIVQQKINVTRALPQQMRFNVTRQDPTVYVSSEVFATSNVQVAAIVNVLLDHRQLMQQALARACPLLKIQQEMAISTSWLFNKGARGEECKSHYDCDAGLFCTKPSSTSLEETSTCDICSFCKVDANDAIDARCPTLMCPTSGNFPACTNAQRLTARATCPSDYQFSVWEYRNASEGLPKIVPPFEPKNREITPYNRIVGAIVISQRRMKPTSCAQSVNKHVQGFMKSVEGVVSCPSSTLDDTPYGYDPSFMTFSAMYNPKLMPEKFYSPLERHLIRSGGETQLSFPIGFFPHKYDSNFFDTNQDGFISDEEASVNVSSFKVAYKDSKYIMPSEADTFKLYFDERLTQMLAQNMIQFAEDGSFIDSQTEEVRVQFLTYNAPKNIFALHEFIFNWQTTGRIPWDYKVNSFSVDFFAGPKAGMQIFLFAVLVTFLLINSYMEVHELLGEIRKYNLTGYLSHPFNWIDWTHFAFMWGTIITCLLHYFDCRQFYMKANYPILFYGPEYSTAGQQRKGITTVQTGSSFQVPLLKSGNAMARHFRTDNKAEMDLLILLEQARTISDSMNLYSFFAGVSVVLFVLRMLKSLDFQERMGLVTRTIARASSDLWHFMLLFAVVFYGYSVVGHMLFGHQYEGMKDMSTACLTLLIFLLSLDTTQFYASMSHAAPDGAFHIFLWSYLFIAFFILLNVFLAILVDAYAKVKEETEGTTGLVEDLLETLWHGLRKTIKARHFVSNQKLEEALVKERETLTSKESQRRILERDLDEERLILLPGGVSLDTHEVAALARRALGRKTDKVHPDAGEEEQLADLFFNEDEIVASADLMNRYGTEPSVISERRKSELLELHDLEGIRRQIGTQIGQVKLLGSQQQVLDLLTSIGKELAPAAIALQKEQEQQVQTAPAPTSVKLLRVTLVRATNLPRMDLFSGCDPYCVLFVNACSGLSTFASEVKHKNVNPVWEQQFEWTTTSRTKVLSVTLWDKDDVTSDDLVGSVQLDLEQLPEGEEQELTLPLQNHKLFRKLRETRLVLRVHKLTETESLKQEKTVSEKGKGPQEEEQEEEEQEEEQKQEQEQVEHVTQIEDLQELDELLENEIGQ
ncbi:hypothetical protein GUITHDRAFT_120654 [Guillardia theta CCMP2712]|uniref:C2 domain-containing protein n=1 Tax=Guillardia theta (strain CCMP2712) TaxID=905079 RepID=L1IAB4_GUITC|nr:hypothetical protein GUITHDRAFT_120654 [Guillardia theta CCMP2712]EKX33173.1 hypothetical protein GUITHDRAFT_120654 [Guillardia theta CCMP2712]|eukprot:XP_005820153.1 hypothetical protein GUITHDRAFT_120654 [Guillardia theta CCMP2712]